MIGLFQADLPIGRYLWKIILALVVLGVLTEQTVTFSSEPLTFVTEILLFFGYTSLVGSIIAFGLLVIAYLVYVIAFYLFGIKGEFYIFDWFEAFLDLSFVIAIFYTVTGFGTNVMREFGVLGLITELFVGTFNTDVLKKEVVETLEIRLNKSGRVITRLLDQDNQNESIADSSDWLKELHKLRNDGWEIIISNTTKSNFYIILERITNKSRFIRERNKQKRA